MGAQGERTMQGQVVDTTMDIFTQSACHELLGASPSLAVLGHQLSFVIDATHSFIVMSGIVAG